MEICGWGLIGLPLIEGGNMDWTDAFYTTVNQYSSLTGFLQHNHIITANIPQL